MTHPDRCTSSNVVPLRLGILPRHRDYLMRWLEAGMRMGLCDADVCREDNRLFDMVLVWVRENADPAYGVHPEGMRWVLTDHLRDHRLGTFATFEAALQAIRPVMPAGAIAAA
ncbi:hypothetical protein KGY14_08585 [Ameyamaea chiangmaiensis]|uniref:Uncharacterized protein n=2 Tax=Ameyamaea chiangmaiensis TaxID=442969 RepID=A0A850PD26_9PROT|nr:hypothetical protein [Ameyamaea chiangmaiensis]NVN42044.1 hypothetical protein [Ameyamaea chiangmaiensis]